MISESIDYDRMWLEQLKAFEHSSDTAAYWNRRSRTFDSRWRTSTYASDLLNRMAISSEDTVLDVACGTGVMAIPISQRAKHVTALDISPGMLCKLHEQITAAGINNITTVNKDWNGVVIGRDIIEHDIVLISRALPNIRLSDTLQKTNRAAKSACYITWRAERTDDWETAVAEAMGKKRKPYPDYRVIEGMLKSMGITPTTDIFESTNEERYPSLEDMVFNMSRGADISESQFARLCDIAGNRYKREGGFYTLTYRMKWALISWKKNNVYITPGLTMSGKQR